MWNKGFDLQDFLCLIMLVLVVLYLYQRWEEGYFSRRGINSLPYTLPFIGHSFKFFTMQEHLKDMIVRHYKAFPGEKYVGVRQFNQINIQINDIELLKRVAVKDFECFVNRQFIISDEQDSIFGNNLFVLKDDKWREMRRSLSPVFTGFKMRNMFKFITKTSKEFVSYFKNNMNEFDNGEKGLMEVEMKDAFSRFATDVVASTAFGIRVDSLNDRTNLFYKMSSALTAVSQMMIFKFFTNKMFPVLSKFTFMKIFNKTIKTFFRKLVKDNIKSREEKQINRPDMIGILMEAKKDEKMGFGKKEAKQNWTDDEMVAQALVFLFGGFDFTSTLMSFICHELAVNQDIMRKLQEEIDQVVSKSKSVKVDYNDLVAMEYLDMVVSETLRKWPVAVSVDRLCVKPYELPPSSEHREPFKVNIGDGIIIPIWAFHHDPRYFPNPEKFDPERFSDENKPNIVPMSYMPFGLGPRNCIGNRFAILEVKAVIFHLLANFDFVPIAKTQNPIKLKSAVTLVPENGFWIGIKPRK